MEIGPNTLASQEITLNRAQAGQDILQKTLEKSDEARQAGQSPERPEPQRVTSIGNQRIDTYA
ncbi:hypothetical protein [Desulfogranum mediterraneum]|uniref:hypothetical protein n=1 Tax=Desulfogranum mediterraneum TaxID=160661 RepID=UPI000411853B|nr:hypothetical protein [Desulfogranum mediterraneum]